jgi:hypothetical protein
MRTCHRHYPGRFNGACSLVYLHCQRPSPCNSKVGSCNYFSGPAQRSLTLRPARSRSRQATLYTESSDSFVASAAASIATGWSEPVPGREFHPLKSSAFYGALLRQLRRSPTTRRLGVTSWLSTIHRLSVAWLEGGKLLNGNLCLFRKPPNARLRAPEHPYGRNIFCHAASWRSASENVEAPIQNVRDIDGLI